MTCADNVLRTYERQLSEPQLIKAFGQVNNWRLIIPPSASKQGYVISLGIIDIHIFTPNAHHEQGKVIDAGIHIYI